MLSKNIFLVSNMSCKRSMSIVDTNYQNVPEINTGGVEFLTQALYKSYVELQRAVTLIELDRSTSFYIKKSKPY